jgi:hypothetical protein
MDDSGPSAIEGTGTFHPQHWYEVTRTCRVRYTYPEAVTVVVAQGDKSVPQGVTFVGTEGELFVDRKKIKSKPDSIAREPISDSDINLPVSADHHQNFLDCVKSRKLPICDVEIGHRSATVCHLGNIAIRLGRKIAWDPTTEAIPGDPEAARMLLRPYRSPWTI